MWRRGDGGRVELLLVDYGPGGGSGVARMTNVVASEEGLPLRAEYFSQTHCVSGPLPQSWLVWIKSKEQETSKAKTERREEERQEERREEGRGERRKEGQEERRENEGQEGQERSWNPTGGGQSKVEKRDKVALVTHSSPKDKDNFVFFSDRLKLASGGGEVVLFSPQVLAAIEPELLKLRAARPALMARPRPGLISYRLRTSAFHALRHPAKLTFPPLSFPLQAAFSRLIRLPPELPLHALHQQFHADRGCKGSRKEKMEMLAPLTNVAARGEFVGLYEALVLSLLAPHLQQAMGCDRVLFQSFPCVRVHRPGEFSIGPHCDAQYQAPDGNINFYLPLTDAIWGTNSLFLESEPGKEDWRPLELRYGDIQRFYGVYCAHFTAENTTSVTRASLDFRLIPGCCFEEEIDSQPKDFRVGGYYSECRLDASGSFKVTRRGYPYWRHGFPHTGK